MTEVRATIVRLLLAHTDLPYGRVAWWATYLTERVQRSVVSGWWQHG